MSGFKTIVIRGNLRPTIVFQISTDILTLYTPALNSHTLFISYFSERFKSKLRKRKPSRKELRKKARTKKKAKKLAYFTSKKENVGVDC